MGDKTLFLRRRLRTKIAMQIPVLMKFNPEYIALGYHIEEPFYVLRQSLDEAWLCVEKNLK